jgi:FKBP-type peptidyl-prolyl cis-trans isomerase
MKKYFGFALSVAFLLGFCVLLASCLSQEPSGPSFQDQLKKDLATIDAYLATNGIAALKDTISGVRYVVNSKGTGKKIKADSVVYLSFKEKVMSSGTVISDAKDAYVPILLNNSNSSLYCWLLILPKLTRGSLVTIYSPSGYAYGTSSSSDGTTLPANSNMIYDMKVFDEAAFDKVAQFRMDTTAIGVYLKANNINAKTDSTGLRYVVTVLGQGAKPKSTSTITFNYDGKLMATPGVSFDKSTTPSISALSGLIKGFQVGMPLLPTGSKATFYIPSSLGYGQFGKFGAIPSNSNLIFDVELVSFQ